MIIVTVGGIDKPLSEVQESWLKEQVLARRRQGVAVCIRVKIQSPDIDLVFATKGCGGAGELQRRLAPKEEHAVKIWERHQLNTEDFAPVQLIAFLKQVESIA